MARAAQHKLIVYCKKCGKQYIRAVDYNGMVAFHERTPQGPGPTIYGTPLCGKCGTRLSIGNLEVIQRLEVGKLV